jgi:amino acid transporter
LSTSPEGAPKAVLSTGDAVGIIVGLVIGAGIFGLPPLVAGSTNDLALFFGVWIAGGIISIIGALCYAELATAYPNAGGEYHFLQRAFGRHLSFLYAWARLAVITTGAIAILAYTFGQYATRLLPLGPYSTSIWAALAVVALTAINIAGIRETSRTQNLLTVLEVLGVVLVIVVGIFLVSPAAPGPAATPADARVDLAFAILFVLFTFGGWNDAAYISAETKGARSIVTALIVSLSLVTVLYLLVNYAYVNALGLGGVAKSQAVAADVLGRGFGDAGSKVISAIIAISALTSINATILVGARSNFALGRDWPLFAWLGHWDGASGAPRNALYVQGAFALVLVAAGAFTEGIKTMVDYTIPVFWGFVMLVGAGLFVLRAKDPATPRPFRVPLYPVTPIIFIATCAFLLYRSITYVQQGALAGIAVLAIGAVLLAFNLRRAPAAAAR